VTYLRARFQMEPSWENWELCGMDGWHEKYRHEVIYMHFCYKLMRLQVMDVPRIWMCTNEYEYYDCVL